MSLKANIRKIAKQWLYGNCPGFAGSFPYFGTKVYFPKGDYIFKEACRQGIYEQDTLYAIMAFAKPGCTVLDVGANIGLLSASVLESCEGTSVASFEPSPSVLPFLRKTVAQSPHASRWQLFDCALSDREGKATFSSPPCAMSAFGGLKNTGRVGGGTTVEVSLRTIDNVWTDLGRPQICVLKCDTEGHELPVLMGSTSCIAATRPAIVLEWNRVNLAASNCDPAELMRWAKGNEYEVFTLVGGIPVLSLNGLSVMVSALNHENFVLLPR
ncbi:MAG: FkbM family methyltransferase [Verrucomicrobiaceae bacterium]